MALQNNLNSNVSRSQAQGKSKKVTRRRKLSIPWPSMRQKGIWMFVTEYCWLCCGIQRWCIKSFQREKIIKSSNKQEDPLIKKATAECKYHCTIPHKSNSNSMKYILSSSLHSTIPLLSWRIKHRILWCKLYITITKAFKKTPWILNGNSIAIVEQRVVDTFVIRIRVYQARDFFFTPTTHRRLFNQFVGSYKLFNWLLRWINERKHGFNSTHGRTKRKIHTVSIQ